jgi:hypothetical protein
MENEKSNLDNFDKFALLVREPDTMTLYRTAFLGKTSHRKKEKCEKKEKFSPSPAMKKSCKNANVS